MNRPQEKGVFGGMAGKRIVDQRNETPEALPPRAFAGTILPPDLAIPCWVAPLQSPTPYHQAKPSIAPNLEPGARFFPTLKFKIAKSAYRLGRSKMAKSAYRLAAQETTKTHARQIRNSGIIVTNTRPQSIHCRF